MEYYSIFEISEKLGIPKNKIYYKIRSDEQFKNFFTKDVKSNSYVVHKNNIDSIANAFNVDIKITENRLTNDPDNTIINREAISDLNNEIIVVLKDEIEFLKKQLIEKDLQISKLLQISQNNQVLLLEEKGSNESSKKTLLDRIKLFFKIN